MLDRVADAGLRRQVDNRIKLVLLKELLQQLHITNVAINDRDAVVAQLKGARLLEPHAVVIVKVIQRHHLVVERVQRHGQVVADEASAACHL